MKTHIPEDTFQQPTGVNFDAIRRSLRRHLFVINRPEFNINSAALRTDFDMHIEHLVAATFRRNEALPGTGLYLTSTDLLLIKPLEMLRVTVSVYASKAGVAPETYATRVVHSANPIMPAVHQDECEYETTNVYSVVGALTVFALEHFWSEHDGLKKHALANLPEVDKHSPFCHWQFQA
ncbi:hypothetical protein ACCY16_17530 [Candidatus Pantoea formicae]|uniref:hypothetical protein n=1 Tax=Candidatus Pantoea formicae TaxID=2608355 RepID=UPI003ED851B8